MTVASLTESRFSEIEALLDETYVAIGVTRRKQPDGWMKTTADLLVEVRRLRSVLRKIADTHGNFEIQATDGKHWACGRGGCPACAARVALGEARR